MITTKWTATLALLLGLAGAASAEPVLPWQLRPVTTSNSVRAESGAAVFNDANGNVNIASTNAMSASYQLNARWAPMLRLGVLANDASGAARDGSTFANPMLGVTYKPTLDDRDVALFAATTLPIGTGGGNEPDPVAAQANAASMTVRPSDDAMFDVNYLTAMVGGDVAFAKHGFTAQAEATLQQSVRVRGDESAASTDAARTRASLGAHVGAHLGSHVSLGGDLLYQRWLSHPTELDSMTDTRAPLADADMSALTMSLGLRVRFRVGPTSVQPGLSFTRGLDATGPTADAMITNRTTAFTLDVPVLF
ncbi:MAG TPA: hypothetical protein VM261_30120 [Kofleriaceae bacterium]|nr:hypothetical protein [Kofleriaceae bacterium]